MYIDGERAHARTFIRMCAIHTTIINLHLFVQVMTLVVVSAYSQVGVRSSTGARVSLSQAASRGLPFFPGYPLPST